MSASALEDELLNEEEYKRVKAEVELNTPIPNWLAYKVIATLESIAALAQEQAKEIERLTQANWKLERQIIQLQGNVFEPQPPESQPGEPDQDSRPW